MNYLCYYCNHEFPAEDAVDGFNEGFKTGFLCPQCGKNIQDNPNKKEWVFSSRSSEKFYGFVVVYCFTAWITLESITPNSWLHYLMAIGGLALILAYGYNIKPKDMYSPTLKTQPVAK
jgi:hypothetical protein